MAGVRRFERDRDWSTSGLPDSDGGGAAMRFVPLALAWRDETLLEAARISAAATHAPPNALEAAMAGAWLAAKVPDGGRWDAGLGTSAIPPLWLEDPPRPAAIADLAGRLAPLWAAA
jgi:ADP-ribosylglycohydrolase